MMDFKTAAQDLRQLASFLQMLARDAARRDGDTDWTARRVVLAVANEPQRLFNRNELRRKYRIRRMTTGANQVVIQSQPPVSATSEGALLNDARTELTDTYPFMYRGEVWAVSDTAAVLLSIEEWSTPSTPER